VRPNGRTGASTARKRGGRLIADSEPAALLQVESAGDLDVLGGYPAAEAFRVRELAQLCGMSQSAFYRNFQAVTAMSPIQFQKQIRLQEARLLLATRPRDVTGVSRHVGYESPSQFSREYRRQFGVPPRQDAATLHELSDAAF
jgi:AraC-like DNA-binding protein